MSLNLFSLMSDSQTQAPVIGGIQNVTTGGVIQIESEKMFFLSASSTAFLNLIRGYDGTIAVPHPVGSEVTIVERNIGVLAVPVQTTVVRDAIVPREGMVIYNDDTDVLNVRTPSAWTSLIADGIPASEKGQPDGVATLDSFGKVPVTQLPNSIMEFKGTWDASSNTPTLADGTGDAGDTYIVNVAGTQDFGSGPITFEVNNFVIYNGTLWEKAGGTSLIFPIQAPSGAEATPSYSWLDNPASGVFFNGEGRTALSDNGTEFMDFGANYVRIRTATSLALQRDGGENDPSIGLGSTGTVGISTSQTGDFIDTFHIMTSDLTNGFMTTRFTVGPVELNAFTQININNNKLINLSDPVDPQDAATKYYVDNSTGLAATKALDNLASVAINTALLPAASNTLDFGSMLKTWKDAHFEGTVHAERFSSESDPTGYIVANGQLTFHVGTRDQINLDGTDANCLIQTLGILNTNPGVRAAIGLHSDPGTAPYVEFDNGNSVFVGQDTTNNFAISPSSSLSAPWLTLNSDGVKLTDGSLSLPSYSFVTEDGLGAYRPAPGVYSIVSGGAEVASFRPSGVQITSDAFPATDGGSNLGTGAKRWGNAVLKDAVYFGAGDFQTKLGWAANVFTFTNTGTDLMTINSIVTNVKTPLKVNNAFILPLIAGTSGQVITSDGAGNSSWATPAASANPALSNLTSPTAVNQHLLPGSNGTLDIGQATPNRWRNGYINQLFSSGLNYGTPGTAGAPIFTQNGQTTGLFFAGFGNLPLKYTKAGTDRGELATADINNNFSIAQSIGAVTYPAVDGTAGQVLTTDGAGIASFQSPAAGGATTALDNLAAVQINSSLLFDTDNAYQVGEEVKRISVLWAAIYGLSDANPINFVDATDGLTKLQVNNFGIATPNGDVNNPGHSFLDDPSSGLYFEPGLGTSLAYAGTQYLRAQVSNNLVVPSGIALNCNKNGSDNDPSVFMGSDGGTGISIDTNGDFISRIHLQTMGQNTSALVTRFTFSWDGMEALDGTSGHPAYSFITDPTMGMWRNGGGKLSFMHTGAEVLSLNDTQVNIELNQSSVVLDDTTGGSEFLRITTGDYIELYAGYATSSIRATINGNEIARFEAAGFFPAASNTSNLGSPTFKWKSIYTGDGLYMTTGSVLAFDYPTQNALLVHDSGSDSIKMYTGGQNSFDFDPAGNFKLNLTGGGIYVKEGSDATSGVATLSGGTVVVSTTKVTANSRIQLTAQNLGTIVVPAALAVSARTAATSFTILSSDVTDTSDIAWLIIEPS